MKKYLSFFTIRFKNGLQYRTAAYAGVATQFAWGGMTLLMFWAFYRSNENSFPMTFPELSSYIWLQQALLGLFMIWFFDNDIFNAIISGNIAYELCRPVDLYSMWFVKNMAVRLANTLLRCLPILIVGAFLPYPFNMSLPITPFAGILFIISVLLGFTLAVSFIMLIYISVFYTMSPLGIRILVISLVEFLSGGIVPIPFFPDNVRTVVSLLPFASMQNTPFLIYTGHIGGYEAVRSVMLQIVWLLFLMLTGRLIMRNALKKVAVQGG